MEKLDNGVLIVAYRNAKGATVERKFANHDDITVMYGRKNKMIAIEEINEAEKWVRTMAFKKILYWCIEYDLRWKY